MTKQEYRQKCHDLRLWRRYHSHIPGYSLELNLFNKVYSGYDSYREECARLFYSACCTADFENAALYIGACKIARSLPGYARLP